MPAYLTHSLMSERVFKDLSKEKILKVPASLDDVKTFSLGTDLAWYSKSRYTSHDKDTRAFILNMINYIRENRLQKDEKVMSLLYGHICHYFLDEKCHPLVYYIEMGLDKASFISNHNFVESYLSAYLCGYEGYDYNKIKADFYNKGDTSYLENVRLLDYTYGRTYGVRGIIASYKKVIKMFSILENSIKRRGINIKSISNLVGFNKFLELNQLTRGELLNIDKNEWLNPVNGDKHFESMIELYEKAIEEAVNAISQVNAFLYDNKFVNLEFIFANLSYNTGLDCNFGNKMVYFRNKVLRKHK